ncbi:hypothetical protein LP417_34900 (plasmid) [Polaromonas sp. P1-6]|nr:hypothetical protein LP417_34900 [Polaromonas sp. P1-6]
MQSWHTTYLGLRELPHEISTFELQSFFTIAALNASSSTPPPRQRPQAWAGIAYRFLAVEWTRTEFGVDRSGNALAAFGQQNRQRHALTGIPQSPVCACAERVSRGDTGILGDVKLMKSKQPKLTASLTGAENIEIDATLPTPNLRCQRQERSAQFGMLYSRLQSGTDLHTAKPSGCSCQGMLI